MGDLATAPADAFLQSLASDEKPCIVDFWAAWCGPCHAVSPLLEKLAVERDLSLIKINIDEQPQLAQAFGIVSLPTILYVEDGEVQRRVVGALSRAEMEKKLLDITR